MACDRRDFLSGRWGRGEGQAGSETTILVSVRPERLARAEAAIKSIDGIDIRGRDARGKLTLAVASGAIGRALGAIGNLPDVLSANVVASGAGSGRREASA